MRDETPISARPWPLRVEVVAVIGFWLTLGVLTAVREVSQDWGEDDLEWGEIAETFAEIGLWALLTPLVFWVVRRYPVTQGAWMRHLMGQVALGIVIAFVVESLTRGLFRPLLTGPLSPNRAWEFTTTFTRLRLLDELIIYVATLAAGYARSTLFQLRERQLEADHLMADRARLEAQLTEARLEALRMQLNPHFLFNTLNAISALVERDPAGVRTMVARLSSLLRRVLDADTTPLTPLRDDADFLRDYLDVQSVRFQDRLRVDEDWAPDTLDALLPPLLLQPLVENAIAHGVSRIEEGLGVIELASRREGNQLVVTVTDNGPGLERSERPGGVGIPNTQARLKALYGDEGHLDLASGVNGGTVATVTLPLQMPADTPLPPALTDRG